MPRAESRRAYADNATTCFHDIGRSAAFIVSTAYAAINRRHRPSVAATCTPSIVYAGLLAEPRRQRCFWFLFSYLRLYAFVRRIFAADFNAGTATESNVYI